MEEKFENIESLHELKKIIADAGTDVSKRTGFWLFEEALEKDPTAYGNIGKAPWYMNYAVLKEDNKTVGMISYSLKKKGFQDSLFISDIQTLKPYKGKLKVYFDYLSKIAKENKRKYLALQYYEEGLKNVYKKFGFKEQSGYPRLMKKKTELQSLSEYIKDN